MAAHRCSSFAQEQLAKHGWKDGQGLGRTESGISEAIKVKLKHDTAGVGYDLGEQFTYHWWDHVFNEAASNIIVEKDQDGVKLSRKENTKGPISNKRLSKDRGKKPLLYGNFVKSATLTAEGLRRDDGGDAASSSSSSEDEAPQETNIDDKFFKACGGRTAHKGARHGLNLSGKLKRIQAQEERAHLPGPVKAITNADNPTSVTGKSDEAPSQGDLREEDGKCRKKKRKSGKDRIPDERMATGDSIPDFATDDRTTASERKKSKRAKRVEEAELSHREYSADDVTEGKLDSHGADGERRKKHKRKNTGENGTVDNREYSADDVIEGKLDSHGGDGEKRKKHKRKNTGENGTVDNHEYSADDVTEGKLDSHGGDGEKRKKHKRKNTGENGTVDNHEYSADDVTEGKLDSHGGDGEKRKKHKRKNTRENGIVDNCEYSADDVTKGKLNSHKGDGDNHEYSAEARASISEEKPAGKAGRKQAEKDQRTREKETQKLIDSEGSKDSNKKGKKKKSRHSHKDKRS